MITALVGVVLLFGVVVFIGAPYLPTLKPQIDEAFNLLSLKKGQHLLELGSGDGRVLKAAAKKGLRATGIEANPLLVIYSKIITWKYRENVTVIWGDYWRSSWPETDGIYTFLLQKYMKKLDNKIVQKYNGKNVKLVSFAFTVPDKKPTKEKKGLYLYTYE